MRMTDFSVKAQPNGHPHFHTPCSGDVAKLDNVAGLPAEPFAEPAGNLTLGLDVVAADKEVVVTRHEGGLDHDLAVHGVQGFHYESVGEFTLHLFSKRVGVADRKRRRPFREVQRIGNVNEDLAAQISRSSLAEGSERIGAIG